MKIQFLFLISFTLSISLFSQNKTGIGNVSDNAGVVIPNAIVQISSSSNTTITYEYICDKNGNYSFDITSDDNSFILNISPSVQSLQFTHEEEILFLANGNNEILFHNVELTANNGINFTIVDTSGDPISNAKITLYDTKRKWEIDSSRIAKAVYTDDNGQVEINSLLPIQYWFNVKEGYQTNRFTLNSTGTAINTTKMTDITVPIRDLTQMEFYMTGLCDNKTWITDSMIVYGITLPYDADTKLLSDATWWDSNGRFGFWWFNPPETIMTYNYLDGTGGGSIIDATNLTITDTTWVGDMQFNGLPVTYFMSVPDLDIINLNLSVGDTTIYLNSNGVANINYDDLWVNSSYCFTCNHDLSQNSFNTNDIGDVEVYVTITDRCGHFAVDTLTITVAASPVTDIIELTTSNILVYPNPSNDLILIECKEDRIKRIELYTINGVLISHFEINSKPFTFNTSEVDKGIYVFKIYTTEGVITKKIVIK